MKRYSEDDIVTIYFVIVEDKHGRRIKGYSDNKDIVKAYIEFHKCKSFHVKSYTGTLHDISEVLNENYHDEISIASIVTRDRNSKHKDRAKEICVPATETELNFIVSESNTYMSSMCDYGYLNKAIPYLKHKYQVALHDIFLNDVIKKVVHIRDSKFISNIEFDQLISLFKYFPDQFGK